MPFHDPGWPQRSLPCGSGKKYKKCCLASERPAAVAQFGSAVQGALDWLMGHHRRAAEAALEEVHQRFDERIGDAAEAIPDHVFET